MHARFGYCFMTPPGSQYPPILREKRLTPAHKVLISGQGGDIEALPVLQDHGDIPSLGFRIGNVAYSADIKNLPDESLSLMQGLDVWLDEPTSRAMHARFGYCFMTPPGSEYPPIAHERRLTPGEAVTISGQGGDIEVMPILQNHGDIPSLGFRIGNVAYSADIKYLPDESLPLMEGLDVWIVDALRRAPHPSHLNLDEALYWIDRMKPKRAVLTNLHTDMDYAVLTAELPIHIAPGFDGMTFDA